MGELGRVQTAWHGPAPGHGRVGPKCSLTVCRLQALRGLAAGLAGWSARGHWPASLPFSHSGISVNIQDLAPSCAGFLFGVANTAGALAGVVGVCLGGYLIETTGSWTSVFNLVAAISSLGLCTFLVFGQAKRVDLSPAHEDL